MAFLKPEYVFRPEQLWRRITGRYQHSETIDVRTPWGLTVRVRRDDAVGRTIALLGVFELPVVEGVFRLVDSGETVVDVGANVGFMTSALASAVGASGRVVAFEAHPEVFRELEANRSRWLDDRPTGTIDLRAHAVSRKPGRVTLFEPSDFARNRGTATVGAEGDGIAVEATTLDDALEGDRIALIKLDVEGHEDAVLAGAEALLAKGGIRDIIFEEHGRYPTAVTRRLEAAGYTVFRLERSLWRPLLLPPDAEQRTPWEAPNLLATHDPVRARERYRRLGWMSLKRKA